MVGRRGFVGAEEEGSRSFWTNFWWSVWSMGWESLGALGGLVEGETWEGGRRLEGEKVTVVEILGGGVSGFGREDGDGDGDDGIEDEDDEGALDLGAKKREITCCFCFPMALWCLPSVVSVLIRFE